jgi:error-prone DNA polymerase
LSMRALCSPENGKRGYRRGTIDRLARYLDSPELARLAASDVYWDRVVAIEPVGDRETYDLSVEGDHNFVADDIVVHNSHAASFALLAYASAYLKVYYPAAFYAALLNNQPMGFYHPATIVRDAERHGQEIRPVDVNRSGWLCTIEDGAGAHADLTAAALNRDPRAAVRLGLRYAKGLREEVGKRIEDERRVGSFGSVADLARRTGVNREELARLAEIGALASLHPERRAALWEAERAMRPAGSLFERLDESPEASPLRPMDAMEQVVADYTGTSLSLGPHPMTFLRRRLARQGVARARDLASLADGSGVRVAGAVIVRQRPGTAKGFVFLNLEDETGLVNVVVRPAFFHRQRFTVMQAPFLLVDGTLQHREGTLAVRAERIRPLAHRFPDVPSHDFH